MAWHQDYSYWTRTTPMNHLTCWIGLDNSAEDNGCLQYVPGSHRWTLLPIVGLAGDMDAIQDVLTPDQWEQFQHPVAIEMPKGHASFHHPLMVHGSFANRTDRPRRAAVLNYFRDGTRSDTDETLLEGVPVIPQGERMQGQFFPVVREVENPVKRTRCARFLLRALRSRRWCVEDSTHPIRNFGSQILVDSRVTSIWLKPGGFSRTSGRAGRISV